METVKNNWDKESTKQRKLIIEGLVMLAFMAGVAIAGITALVGIASGACFSCHSAMKL